MKIRFDHRFISWYLEEALIAKFGKNVKFQPDTLADGMDRYVSAVYKISIPTTKGTSHWYIYFRNKRCINDEGDVEFTTLSSFDLRKKDSFNIQNKTHFKDITEIQPFIGAGDKDEVKKALAIVADKITDYINNNI